MASTMQPVKIQHISAVELDETTAFNLFLSGGLDTVAVPLSELAAVKADPALSPLLHGQQAGCTYYYGFSSSQEPFDDVLVRKAFTAAINRQGLIDTVLGGGPPLAQTLTSKGIFGYVDGVAEGVGISYDPTQAQAWLSTAGFPGGAGLPPITLSFNTHPGHQSIAEFIRQNWIDNLNVTVTLRRSSLLVPGWQW
jgi:oligopeptide transport system substrate-binding protein